MSEPRRPDVLLGIDRIEPAGRKLLRLEVRNSQVPIERKPEWIKTRLKTGPEYTELKSLVRREGLHTVCEEAGCPNIYECWEDREATFLIGGDQCTRRCDFCQIDTGKPADFDADEPRRVAESVATMGLRYATVTGVARDDLPDGGAWLYAETVRQIHAAAARLRRRAAHPRLQRRPRPARRGLLLPARGARAQRRDGAAHLQADPPRLPLRPLPVGDHRRPRGRAGHQVQPDPGHGRGAARGRRDHAGAARRRLRPADDHPVPAPLAPAPPRRPLGEARRVRRASRPRPSGSASPACWPGRWCAAPTAPAGSTSRPSRPAVSTPTVLSSVGPLQGPAASLRVAGGSGSLSWGHGTQQAHRRDRSRAARPAAARRRRRGERLAPRRRRRRPARAGQGAQAGQGRASRRSAG